MSEKDRRVAHVIDGLALPRFDDETAAGAEINHAAVGRGGRRVPCRNEGEVEIPMIQGSAGVAGIDLLHAEPRHMHGKLEHGKERRAGLFADRDRIARMIVMTVRQSHMGDALGHVVHA
jgi:hypothetical protein